MAEVQAQPIDVPEHKVESHAADKDTLIARLDELLEKYLYTLDEYQKVREVLSKQLSSGYLSLAQANFQNRSTTHYGRDNYDERMQAVRKVTIQGEESSTPESQLSISIASEKAPTTTSGKPKDDEDPKPEPTPPQGSEKAKASSSSKPKPIDPLRWFGILVPPALRTAQSSFVSAVEDSVPTLANIARGLRSQEIEIGRVRKQIKKV